VHSGGSRRRGKPRSRILYWFRTPPGVRVGRSALDEEAIKLIEVHNPGVEFDWTRILKGEAPERGSKEMEATPQAEDEAPPAAAPVEAPPTVAQAKLGAEGLARLRARHAEILARISEGIPDPARQDELKAQADRLNPDTWVTDAEVSAGLESYEAVFESLRTAVGRRRKRRRSRRPRSSQPASPQPIVEAEGREAEGREDEEEI
jgi:hypothetical protein